MILPIDALLPDILASLESHPNLIIEASPGSGKTTRVPPALLQSSFFLPEQQILVLEPRRLAAKYSAQRIASLLGSAVGDVVGYQFRFENLSHPRTRLKFVTEGMLMRLLIGSPKLDRVAAVVLDEFHERHIHSDVALSYLKWLQTQHRADLRIILMSATLESEPLSQFLSSPQGYAKNLQPAPILRLKTELHPVTTHYLPSPLSKSLDQAVYEAVLQAMQETLGDILVFLPGIAEMRRCQGRLAALSQIRVLLLHGELSRLKQDEALTPGGGRKVILSTNVAETSLTIPGITAVIDSGLHRMASHSWWSGIPSLKTRTISRASAIQRSGRAGRTGPGKCFRLYTKGDFDTRAGFEKPEILRSDLAQTLLDLKALGVSTAEFPWFEPPPSSSLAASEDLLYRLQATTRVGLLTEMGRQMSQIAAHPRISRMLLEAHKLGVFREATFLAAALVEGKIESTNPLETLVNYFKDPSLVKAQSIFCQALRVPSDHSRPLSRPSPKTIAHLAYSILMGFPDRVAQKRSLGNHLTRSKTNKQELLLSSGGSALLEEASTDPGEEFLVLLDLQEQQDQNQKKSNLHVRSFIPIHEDWLLDVSPIGIEEDQQHTWDDQRQRVLCSSRLTYGKLILSESISTPKAHSETLEILIKNALGLNPVQAQIQDWVSALTLLSRDSESMTVESAFARAKIYSENLNTPMQDLWTQLKPHLEGKSSLEELKEIDWPLIVLQALLGDHAVSLSELLPLHLVLPSGRRAKIHYTPTQPPWVASRLQDFFGMKKGPVLLKGRIPLSIHLLAPNQRPVQVTTDLESFWKNHYPKLRPALSRRYPRHHWPVRPEGPEGV